MNRVETIESTVGEVVAELSRLGLPARTRVVLTVEPDNWIVRARAFTRPLVEAAGWTDADVDRIIDEERQAVQHLF